MGRTEMEAIKIKVTGTSPLMMHAGTLAQR